MNFKELFNKNFVLYTLKFLLIFCFLYFGTKAWIGLTMPGGLYSPFIEANLDYVSWLRNSLLYGAKFFLALIKYETVFVGKYNLRLIDGHGIHMVYSCLGYGVMSFWAAFVIANTGTLLKKISWLGGGLFTLWLINVLRIAALVLSRNNKTTIFHSISHHTMFTIVAYVLIFFMMYLFDRFSSKADPA